MLTELRVENLGIIAELLVPMAAGMTVITGETGAGKTLLVDALELLCGGRADPGAVRDGADRSAGRGPVRRRRRRGRARARHSDRRSEPRLRRTGGSQPRANSSSRAASSSICTASTHISRCSRRRSNARCSTAPRAPAAVGALRASCRLRGPRFAGVDDELAGLGGDDRARAREVDLLRYQVAEIDAAAVIATRRGRTARDEAEAVLADAEAHRDALAVAHAALEGAAEDAVGGAVGALAARAPFAALADRLHALQSRDRRSSHTTSA